MRENNQFTNQTVTYTYDVWGNLTAKNVYAYTTATDYAYTTATDPGTPTSTITYGYTNTGWGGSADQLWRGDDLLRRHGEPRDLQEQDINLAWEAADGVTGWTTCTYDINGFRPPKNKE